MYLPTVFTEGTLEGLNDWKKAGYGGPRPPIGKHLFYLLGASRYRYLKDWSLQVLTLWLYGIPLVAVAFLGIEIGSVTSAAWRAI